MFLLPDDYWSVKHIPEKGKGVFAKKKITAGTIIGDYIGQVIKTSEYDLTKDAAGLYLTYFTDHASIYPDLKTDGIHLVNHSCAPNCWVYIYRGHTLFFSLRDIKVGEELTISYLLSPKDETCDVCTHICKCDSSSCVGTFHLTKEKYKEWQQFLDREKKKTRVSPFVYGELLLKLKLYPTIDFTNSIYAKIMT